MAKAREGRASFYRGKIKNSKYRVQGLLTPGGRRSFERCRREFSREHRIERGSDADVIEWLARERVKLLERGATISS